VYARRVDPAGVFEMPLPPYCLYSLIGSGVACGIAGAGVRLGSSSERFNNDFKSSSTWSVQAFSALAAELVLGSRPLK